MGDLEEVVEIRDSGSSTSLLSTWPNESLGY